MNYDLGFNLVIKASDMLSFTEIILCSARNENVVTTALVKFGHKYGA